MKKVVTVCPYCAVRIESIADQHAAERYVIEEYEKLKLRLRALE